MNRIVESAGHFCHPSCGERAAMAIWELAQNLLKYGAEDDDGVVGTIAVAVEGPVVRVRTRNAVDSPETARVVLDAIARLSSTSDVTELYRGRMREILDNRDHPRARLGLLRVALEGGFRLSCSYEARVLEIGAERKCDQSS